MENQHRQIKGYRELSESEIALMNRIKQLESEVYALIQDMMHMPNSTSQTSPDGSTAPNGRWTAIGQTQVQLGFMALVRAVAKPTAF